MENLHSIQPNININIFPQILLSFGCLCLVCFVVGIIIYKYYKNKNGSVKEQLPKQLPRKSLQDEKKEAIERLHQLLSSQTAVTSKYSDLSKIIRAFVDTTKNNNALAKTKTELRAMQRQQLDHILDKCYVVQFAQVQADEHMFSELINNTIEVVQKWD